MYLVVILALSAVVAADDKYITTYDNIDIDDVLGNQRLLNGYFKCLMDRGRCSPEGATLKGYLPDAIQTDCEKCSEKQKEIVHRILKFLYNNNKVAYKELESKYDPQRKYHGKFLPKAEE